MEHNRLKEIIAAVEDLKPTHVYSQIKTIYNENDHLYNHIVNHYVVAVSSDNSYFWNSHPILTSYKCSKYTDFLYYKIHSLSNNRTGYELSYTPCNRTKSHLMGNFRLEFVDRPEIKLQMDDRPVVIDILNSCFPNLIVDLIIGYLLFIPKLEEFSFFILYKENITFTNPAKFIPTENISYLKFVCYNQPAKFKLVCNLVYLQDKDNQIIKNYFNYDDCSSIKLMIER